MNKANVYIKPDTYSKNAVRVVFFNRKIEVYEIQNGLEQFVGYLTWHDSSNLWPFAKQAIKDAIAKYPLCSDTLTILDCLQFQGMLPEQGLI